MVSPYLTREAVIIALGPDMRDSTDSYLALLDQDHTHNANQREAARRERIRRKIFNEGERK